jgi:MFS family permease
MFSADPAGLRFGPFWLRPGLTRGNAATVMFASLTTIAMVVYISLIQPYVLNEIVPVPEARQGKVIGYLTAMQEVVVVLLVGFIGAWSDRVGRRLVYVLGFTLMAAGYAAVTLAQTETELYAYRIVFALGIAAVPVMLSTTNQDTPQEVSRGKWIGTNNILQGLGVLLIATVILGQMPQWYARAGFDAVAAGRLSLWTAAGFCLLVAAVLWRGLPQVTGDTSRRSSLANRFGEGLREGLNNPRLAVAYGAAFISRGDMVIVGNFLTLWVTRDGIDQGLTTAEATGRAFMLFGIVQASALLWAACMGIMADRVNRMSALCIALVVATAGYGAMGLIGDPYGPYVIPLAILLGFGEVSVIVAGGVLLGQEARASVRGAIVGCFNLMGALGIVVVSGVSGLLFDAVGRNIPFVMMGALNGLLLVSALYVRWRAGQPAPARAGVTL